MKAALLTAILLAAGCPPTPPGPPSTITCGFNDAGMCAGTCPEGQECDPVGTTGCACKPDAGVFCAFDKAHVCGGPCPANQSCQQKGATVCACFPAVSN